MSKIEISLGGKEVGVADNASVDLATGCSNGCVGCYAAKTSRQGHKFFTEEPIAKEFDEDVFRKSCRSVLKKGISIVRLGKHSDPGLSNLTGTLLKVLTAATEEGIRFVVVSKSLCFQQEIAEALKKGNHTLHISLGMMSKAIEDPYRVRNFKLFKKYGVNAKVRIADDVTQPMSKDYKKYKLSYRDVIVTPMRFPSRKDAELYDVDLSNYVWKNGFYRPTITNADWDLSTNWCGEVGEEVRCCNCLIGE